MCRKLLIVILSLVGFASAAKADLYRLDSQVGTGSSLVFGLEGSDDIFFGLHGDYMVNLYSWSTSLYFQTDYTVDIFHTDVSGVNWSLITTKDFGTVKAGGYIGALMLRDSNILFAGGAIGMVQLGSHSFLQGEIGALTDGEDNYIFADNVYYGQVRVDHDLNDQMGIYAKYSATQSTAGTIGRGLLGVTYTPTASPWHFTGGVGAFQFQGELSPLLSLEFKYSLGGDELPQTPSALASRPFDRFDFFDFNIR